MNLIYIKTTFAFCTLIALCGCTNFIANKIIAPPIQDVTGNISEGIRKVEVCDKNSVCLNILAVNDFNVYKTNLSFNFKINDNHKVWQYSHENQKLPQTKEHLIFIFTGYNQPTDILHIHQRWLQHVTGAKVFVVPSADTSEQFRFGLDFVNPIVSEIQRRKPNKVHLVAFSMGAIAAQAVSEKVQSSHLHLIAPMTDFKYSATAIWKMLHNQYFYSKFISQNVVAQAIEAVQKNAKVDIRKLDIINKVQYSNTPTYVYTSLIDKITLANDWRNIESQNIKINTYQNLNHIEMIALLNETLLVDFASNILEEKVHQNDVRIVGLMCNYNDDTCLQKQLKVN